MITQDERVYFAIPTPYTIGESFDTLEAAVVEAATRVIEYDRSNRYKGTLIPTREVVDQRIADADGDRPVRRFTISMEEVR
jgi:hypothetical protein